MVVVLECEQDDSFEFLMDQGARISAYFDVAHRSMVNRAEALENAPQLVEYDDDKIQYAEEVLDKSREDIEDSHYRKMSNTSTEYDPLCGVSAEVKYIWQKLSHDLDFYTQDSYDRILPEHLPRQFKEEIERNTPDII